MSIGILRYPNKILLKQYAAEFRLDKEFVLSVKDTPIHEYNFTVFE